MKALYRGFRIGWMPDTAIIWTPTEIESLVRKHVRFRELGKHWSRCPDVASRFASGLGAIGHSYPGNEAHKYPTHIFIGVVLMTRGSGKVGPYRHEKENVLQVGMTVKITRLDIVKITRLDIVMLDYHSGGSGLPGGSADVSWEGQI